MKIIIKYTNGNMITESISDFGFYHSTSDFYLHVGYVKNPTDVIFTEALRVDIPLDPEYIDEISIKEFNT